MECIMHITIFINDSYYQIQNMKAVIKVFLNNEQKFRTQHAYIDGIVKTIVLVKFVFNFNILDVAFKIAVTGTTIISEWNMLMDSHPHGILHFPLIASSILDNIRNTFVFVGNSTNMESEVF